MRKPENDQLQSALLITKPFRLEVWIIWMVSIIFCGLTIWMFTRFDMTTPSSFCDWLANDAMLLKVSFWYSFGMSIAQGEHFSLKLRNIEAIRHDRGFMHIIVEIKCILIASSQVLIKIDFCIDS